MCIYVFIANYTLPYLASLHIQDKKLNPVSVSSTEGQQDLGGIEAKNSDELGTGSGATSGF